MTSKRDSLALMACALMLATMARPVTAQLASEETCAKFAVDHAAFASCDDERVALSGDVPALSPAAAYELKSTQGANVVFLDVRSRIEAAMRREAEGVDFVVPYRDVVYPLRWDSARGSLALVPNPGFLAHVEAIVSVRGGNADTPIVLICATGNRATAAAQALREAGFRRVFVVAGGLDGRTDAAGWSASGLPVLASAGEEQLFGLRD